MRILIIADTKIKDEELDELQTNFIDLVYTHTGITPEFYIESQNWAGYRTEVDSDGDIRIHPKTLLEVENDVNKRYLSYGVDHIVLLIHEDNWKSDGPDWKGIWGTNFSNLHYTYHTHYCRFDRDNMANSLGTLYHEWMHSLDALIQTMLGIDIRPIIGVTNYDAEVVHGKSSRFDYIRHKENTEVLRTLAPYLKGAYDKRLQLHNKDIGTLKKIIEVINIFLNKVKKNGVSA